MLNPFTLVGHKNVRLEVDATNTDEYAFVVPELDEAGRTVSYTLTYCEASVRRLHKANRLLSKIPYEQLKAAILVHEIAHIHADVGAVRLPSKSKLFAFLWNVLVDSHDEWHFARWFPSYAAHIQLVAVLLKARPLIAEKNETLTPKQKEFAKALKTIFTMIRFGRIDKGAPPELVNFVLRCMLPAITGTHKDTLCATVALHEYLRQNFSDMAAWEELQQQNHDGEYVPITEQELEDIMQGEVIAGVDAADIAVALLKKELPRGMDRSAGTVLYDDGDDSFYVAITTRYEAVIVDIASNFERYINTVVEMPSYDGELNMSILAQQRAYEGSFTGEEYQVYKQRRLQELTGRVALLQDISGSTWSVREQYAAACVIFLAAFERLENFRVAYLMFNDRCHEVAGFQDDLSKSAIKPQGSGGTLISEALDITDAYAWDSEWFNIRFVITDGAISDFESERARIAELQESKGVYTFLVEIVSKYSSFRPDYKYAFQSTIEDLAARLASCVIQVIVQHKQYLERV